MTDCAKIVAQHFNILLIMVAYTTVRYGNIVLKTTLEDNRTMTFYTKLALHKKEQIVYIKSWKDYAAFLSWKQFMNFDFSKFM